MRTIIVPPAPVSPEVRDLTELGKLVRHRRASSGLRVDDTAALCGVSSGSLSKLENGKQGLATDKLLRVLDGLGLVMLLVPREDVAGCWMDKGATDDSHPRRL